MLCNWNTAISTRSLFLAVDLESDSDTITMVEDVAEDVAVDVAVVDVAVVVVAMCVHVQSKLPVSCLR